MSNAGKVAEVLSMEDNSASNIFTPVFWGTVTLHVKYSKLLKLW